MQTEPTRTHTVRMVAVAVPDTVIARANYNSSHVWVLSVSVVSLSVSLSLEGSVTRVLDESIYCTPLVRPAEFFSFLFSRRNLTVLLTSSTVRIYSYANTQLWSALCVSYCCIKLQLLVSSTMVQYGTKAGTCSLVAESTAVYANPPERGSGPTPTLVRAGSP